MDFTKTPICRRMLDGRPAFMLAVGGNNGCVDVIHIDGGIVGRLSAGCLEFVPDSFGMPGLVRCCLEHGVQVGVVKLVTEAYWREKDLLVEFLAYCRPELFVGEHGLDSKTAPWSMMMRNAATELGSPERVLQVAKMSALPWQVRVRLLKTVADNVEVAAQIIRECCDPTAVHAGTDKTVRLKHTVDELEEYLGHNDPAALVLGFASADKSDLAMLGAFANLSAAPKLAQWIEAYAAPPTKADSK